MKTLYTLAFPRLSDSDRRFIDAFRREHDALLAGVVAPHFTLVFACSVIPEAEYAAHVERVAAGAKAITFACRYAMLGRDHEKPVAHVFLVPDEGFGAISRLHDALHQGVLAPQLRLDLAYVPHITIGTMADRERAKQLCGQLNARGVSVHGRIESVCVCSYDGETLHELSSFGLRA